ncbi:MAG: hypothetical protein Q4G51_07020 [Dermatophilus congolensis]|nr:hypothetical protein [Dermatophilus congolensis]
MNVVSVSISILVLTGIAGVAAIAYFWVRGNDGLAMRRWLLVVFVAAYVVSGLVHVLGISTSRGFYEAMPASPYDSNTGLLVAAWCTPIGLAGLVLGLSARWKAPPTTRRRAPYSMADSHRLFTLSMALLLSAAGAVGVIRMRGLAAAASGDRIIAIDGGMARYAFLSSWMPWGVLLLTLCFVLRQKTAAADMWNTLVMGGAVGVIALSSSWTGGRTDLPQFTLPLLVVVLPMLRGLRTPIAVGGGLAAFALIYAQTINRTGEGTFSLAALLDWQWGRFSMAAWAGRYVAEHGYLHGETLLAGFAAVPMAFLHLAGVKGGDWSTITAYSGGWFHGDMEMIFTVPGMSAELYANFGYLGVFVGYLVLGLVAALVADLYQHADLELTRALLGYLFGALLLQTANAQSGAFTPLILLTGLPLIGFTVLEILTRQYDRIRERRLSDPFIPSRPAPFRPQWRRPVSR